MKNLKLILSSILVIIASMSIKAQTSVTTATKTQKTRTIDKNSDYMSVEMENKIKSYLISGTIPASLPKYVSGTKEDYNKILKGWAKENLNLVKPEFHEKILGTAKPKKPTRRKE